MFPTNNKPTFAMPNVPLPFGTNATPNQPFGQSRSFGNFFSSNLGGTPPFGAASPPCGNPNLAIGGGSKPGAGRGCTQSPFAPPGTMWQLPTEAFGPLGTTIRFCPITSTDAVQRCGVAHSVPVKFNDITLMREYEGKSTEELRWEDYQYNRKGPQGTKGPFGRAPPFASQMETASALETAPHQASPKMEFDKPPVSVGPMFSFNPSSSVPSTSTSIFGMRVGQVPTTKTFDFGENPPTPRAPHTFNSQFGLASLQVPPALAPGIPTMKASTTSKFTQTSSFGDAPPAFQPFQSPFGNQPQVDAFALGNSMFYRKPFDPPVGAWPCQQQQGTSPFPSVSTIELKAPSDLHSFIGNLYEPFPHREIFNDIDAKKYDDDKETNTIVRSTKGEPIPPFPPPSTRSFSINQAAPTRNSKKTLHAGMKSFLVDDSLKNALMPSRKHLVINKEKKNLPSAFSGVLKGIYHQKIQTESPHNGQTLPSVKYPDFQSQTSAAPNHDNALNQGNCGVKLTRPHYYIKPPLDRLHEYRNEHGECLVRGFTVGRRGFGEIRFPDEIDVSNLDLDEIVHFAHREVTIYLPNAPKPAVGKGLNRRAEITLEQVWPRHLDGTDKDAFVARLIFITKKQNATFVEYRPDTGSLVFAVEHFSKYYFGEPEDEELASGIKTEKDEGQRHPASFFQSESNEVDFRNVKRPRKMSAGWAKYYALLCRHDCPAPLLTPRTCMDIGLWKGRSFKVGWGRNSELTTLATSLPNAIVYLEVKNDCPCDSKQLEEYLGVAFEESAVSVDASCAPLFEMRNRSSLLRRFCQTKSQGVLYGAVWNLCCALWGPEATAATSRRELFSKWLEDMTFSNLRRELNYQGCAIKKVFTYLTCHRTGAAAELALREGLPRMAVLVSQAGNNQASRGLVQKQLAQWRADGALSHISRDITKIYMLLGGVPSFCGINVFEDLDWKHALGVQFWYMCPPGVSLVEAVRQYEKNERQLYRVETNDVLCCLMRIFIDPALAIERVADPCHYTGNSLDYTLSWLLFQTLTSLGVGLVAPDVANALHASFAHQLQQLGLWKWSAFVLLFVRDASARADLLVRLLERNLEPSGAGPGDSLVNDLQVPPQWVHRSLACRASAAGRFVEAYRHLLLAQDWIAANEVAVRRLIPELVSTGQMEKLWALLAGLIAGRASILGWSVQAGLVLDLLRFFQDVRGRSDWQCLQRDLTDLCVRLRSFPVKTLQDVVAVSEFSRLVALVVKATLYKSEPQVAFNLIKMLVMPSDYKYADLLGLLL